MFLFAYLSSQIHMRGSKERLVKLWIVQYSVDRICQMIAARRAVQTQHFQTNIDLDCWSKLQTSGAKSNPASGKKLAAFTTRDKGKGCRQPCRSCWWGYISARGNGGFTTNVSNLRMAIRLFDTEVEAKLLYPCSCDCNSVARLYCTWSRMTNGASSCIWASYGDGL